MDALEIRRLHVRYHVPPGGLAERERLDRILGEVVERELDDALRALPGATREEVCVRSLAAPVRLRLDATDRRLAGAWSEALVRALAARIQAGGPGVVRYASRVEALGEIAISVTRGDLGHAWAWQQLGLWPSGEAAGAVDPVPQVVRELAAAPAAITPVLASLAAAGLAGRFLTLAGGVAIERLAAAALGVAIGPDRGEVMPRPDVATTTRTPGSPPDDAPDVDRFLRSPLGREAAVLGPGLEPPARRALAMLLVLAGDPGVARGASRTAAIVAALGDRLERGVAPVPEGEARAPVGEAGGDGRLPLATAPAAGPGTAEAPRDAGISGAPSPAASPAERPPDTDPAAEAAATGAAPRRQAGSTSAGGLLYLLHVVGDQEVARRLATGPAYRGRAVRWWLHRVAMELAGIGPDDPAALAFAGLGPGERAPSDDEPPPTPRERRAAGHLASGVAAAAAVRLRLEEPSPATVIDRVCRRPAEIVADPGWLEVRMALEAVDLDVRRAGLDRDPGFVPWLGVVVAFRYG